VTLVADVQICGSLFPPADREEANKEHSVSDNSPSTTGSRHEHELLTVEEVAEILHIGRDRIYYLIRTRQLRSIKIGKLRRISRSWITEFVERLEAEDAVIE
jgi:excisionase family DNA binding protein